LGPGGRAFGLLGVWGGLLLAWPGWAGEVWIDDFETPGTWTHHPDGGIEVELAQDTETVKSGQAALRIRYRDAAPHWGNLQAAVTVPPNAVAVECWLYRHQAAPNAAMHLWLFEPDGDGYVARLTAEEKILGDLPNGWHRARVPLGAFRYEPRGNKQREFLTIHKMLLGCNFGDFDVTLDALKFITKEDRKMSTPPRTKDLQVQRTPRGAVAVLKDGTFPVSGAASSPEALADALRGAGYGVTFLTAADLTDPAVLKRENFDLLVLPYGASYPAGGKEALVAYLQAGGSFFATGGYAFDHLLVFGDGGWATVDPTVTAAEMDTAAPTEVRINTRFGQPGDTLGLAPEQIGVFDPSYELRRVASAQTAPGQHVMDEPMRLEGPLEGFAAVAMTGSNSPVFPWVYGRWIPLFTAYDRYGRERGAIGALVHHYAGPFARSSWAFFGVTNRDLWGPDGWGTEPFLAMVEALLAKTFLHELTTDLACYRPGETVQVSVKVSNFGAETRAARVRFEVAPGGQKPAAELPVAWAGELQPGDTETVTWDFAPAQFEADFYCVTAYLDVEEECVDEMRTGFCVWAENVLRKGFPVAFHDNYFHHGQTPRFLLGTNQTGMMWFSANENPLVWKRDFEQMQAYGINLLRILHFSPFSEGGYEGKPTNNPLGLKTRPEKLLRQTDAIVQLAQQHQVILFLSLHDWMGVELTDEQLAAQREWNEFWVGRYRDMPGVIFDIQNEPSVGLPNWPHVLALWNEFLQEKYGSREATLAAWGVTEQPEPFDFSAISNAWEDVKAHDLELFKVELLNRWVEENAKGIRAGDPDAPLCVGYLPGLRPADKLLGTKHTDFSNMHFYGRGRDFPRQFKIIDRRFAGKSFSLGEFGAQAAHDARVQGQTGDRPEASLEHFLRVGHYALGMGASFVANWDWKDFRDCVFPWGLNHADLVPKPVLQAFRHMALLFRFVEPRYEDPGLYLLVPDSHRLGSKWEEVHNAILHSLDLLLSCHVNFNVINEYDLDQLPNTARALLWPIPYCPNDDTFARAVDFVRRGGSLYLSGDVSFDERRRPTRSDRLAQLGFQPSAISHQPSADPPPLTPNPGSPTPGPQPLNPFSVPDEAFDRPPLTARLGAGQVFFVPYPLELRPRDGNRAVYRDFLEFAQIQPLGLEPDLGGVHVFSLPTRPGDTAYVLFNAASPPYEGGAGGGAEEQIVTLTDPPEPVELTLRRDRPGFVLVGPRGEIKALESQGRVRIGGQIVLDGASHVLLAAVDGQDFRQSAALVVLPLEPGRLRLATDRAWRRPRAEVGEVAAGGWRSLETMDVAFAAQGLTFDVDEDRALNVILCAEADGFEAVAGRVVAELCLKD